MKPREEVKRNLVRNWVAKAEKDFSLAGHLVAEDSPYLEAIGFNSQQAAEKYLKAVLVLHQIPFPKTHNLGELLDLIAAINLTLADSLRDVTWLNPYGVDYRYPGEFSEMTSDDARVAFQRAGKVRASILPLLERYLEEDPPQD